MLRASDKIYSLPNSKRTSDQTKQIKSVVQDEFNIFVNPNHYLTDLSAGMEDEKLLLYLKKNKKEK